MPDSTSTYTVTGMTCEHCAAAVTEEVNAIDGVTDVEVDLESGRLTIVGARVTTGAVRAAVEEAGYDLAG